MWLFPGVLGKHVMRSVERKELDEKRSREIEQPPWKDKEEEDSDEDDILEATRINFNMTIFLKRFFTITFSYSSSFQFLTYLQNRRSPH